MSTTVIHVRDFDPARGDIYIGRAVPRKGLKASPWANPFVIGRDGTREEVIAKHERWVRTSDDPCAVWIRANIHLLRGHRIACHCFPDPCHGDTYVTMAEEGATDR